MGLQEITPLQNYLAGLRDFPTDVCNAVFMVMKPSRGYDCAYC